MAGSNTVYATGAAHFDTAQPNLTQVGIMAINTTGGGKLRESSRTAMTSNGNDINDRPDGDRRRQCPSRDSAASTRTWRW